MAGKGRRSPHTSTMRTARLLFFNTLDVDIFRVDGFHYAIRYR